MVGDKIDLIPENSKNIFRSRLFGILQNYLNSTHKRNPENDDV